MVATVRNKPAKPLILFLKITLIILAVLAGAGCTREPQAPPRIGTYVWPGYEPLYLARELGYYPPGSVKLVEYSSASQVIRAFRNGVIDAATLTLDEVLLLSETISDLSIVLGFGFGVGPSQRTTTPI